MKRTLRLIAAWGVCVGVAYTVGVKRADAIRNNPPLTCFLPNGRCIAVPSPAQCVAQGGQLQNCF